MNRIRYQILGLVIGIYIFSGCSAITDLINNNPASQNAGEAEILVKVQGNSIQNTGTAIDFGNTIESFQSLPISIKIENRGDSVLLLNPEILSTDNVNFEYTFVSESTSENTIQIEKYEFVKCNVTFTPDTIGEHSSTFTFRYNDNQEFSCKVAGLCRGDGHLEQLSQVKIPVSSNGLAPLISKAILPQGNKNIYFQSGQSWYWFDFNPSTGTLTTQDNNSITNPDINTILTSPFDISNNQEYIYWQGADNFHILSRNTNSGALSIQGMKAALDNPNVVSIYSTRGIICHPFESFVYLFQTGSPQGMIYNTGDLSGSPGFTISGVRSVYNFSNDGYFLYSQNEDSNIQWHAVNHSTGNLTLAGTSSDSFLVNSSLHFVEGGYVYAFDNDTNLLHLYERNAATGELDHFKTIEIDPTEFSLPDNSNPPLLTIHVPPDGENVYFYFYFYNASSVWESRMYGYIFDKSEFELKVRTDFIPGGTGFYNGAFSDDGKYYLLWEPEESGEETNLIIYKRSFD